MFLHKKASRKRKLEQEPEVFKGEVHHVRALLQMKNPNAKKSKKPVDQAAEAAKILKLVG